jgi:hypothetical protein
MCISNDLLVTSLPKVFHDKYTFSLPTHVKIPYIYALVQPIWLRCTCKHCMHKKVQGALINIQGCWYNLSYVHGWNNWLTPCRWVAVLKSSCHWRRSSSAHGSQTDLQKQMLITKLLSCKKAKIEEYWKFNYIMTFVRRKKPMLRSRSRTI